MTAEIATADEFDVVVDNGGTIWLRLPNGWSYLSSHTAVSWDIHNVLPAQYEPYRGLDKAAALAINTYLEGSDARLAHGALGS